jgi:hypothetical protein
MSFKALKCKTIRVSLETRFRFCYCSWVQGIFRCKNFSWDHIPVPDDYKRSMSRSLTDSVQDLRKWSWMSWSRNGLNWSFHRAILCSSYSDLTCLSNNAVKREMAITFSIENDVFWNAMFIAILIRCDQLCNWMFVKPKFDWSILLL